jgi:predicted RNase H-related nuclease YkuK (DUF458 family)
VKAKPSEIKKMAQLLETEADSSEEMAKKVWDLVEEITANREAFMAIVVHPSIEVAVAIGPYNTRNSLIKDYKKHVSAIDDKSYGLIAYVKDPSLA